jgi:hypothetical protein
MTAGGDGEAPAERMINPKDMKAMTHTTHAPMYHRVVTRLLMPRLLDRSWSDSSIE